MFITYIVIVLHTKHLKCKIKLQCNIHRKAIASESLSDMKRAMKNVAGNISCLYYDLLSFLSDLSTNKLN